MPPDPWAYIISDFQWSDVFFAEMQNRGIKPREAKIGHWPEETSPKYRLEYAYGIMLNLRGDIKKKVSTKTIDLEFLWKWGEYQKAMAIIHGSLPGLMQRSPEKSTKKSNLKFAARAWYTLWYDHYQKLKDPKIISREVFNKYFERILREMISNKRDTPLFLIELINAYASDPYDSYFTMSEYFRGKFTGKEYKSIFEYALRTKDELPPVGEEHYPLIK